MRSESAENTPSRGHGGGVWIVDVPEGADEAALHRRLLGLTFFERRLREARRRGVRRVVVRLPPGLEPDALPALRDPARCPAWSTQLGGAPPPDGVVVPMFAVLDPAVGHVAVQMRLDPHRPWGEAVRWYRRHIVETSNAGVVAKRLNKPISLALSTRLARTRLTPNQLTFLNLGVGLASGLLAAQAGYFSVVAGAVLFQLASILDGVDGEVAKFRLEDSRLGAWLDTFGDNASLVAFLVGCGVHVARFSPLDPATIGAWVAVTAVLFVTYLAVQMRFCASRLGSASLAVWMNQYVRRLPRRDPAVRFVLATGRALQKDFFSIAFLAIALTGRLEILLFGGGVVMAVALVCALYLNLRYGGGLDAEHA